MFVYLTLLGACYAQRDKKHIQFTLVYDSLPPRFASFTAFLGNLIILAAFAIAFVPTVKYINFMGMQTTAVLHIGLNIIYMPYIVFVCLMVIYLIMEMVDQFMVFAGLKKKVALKVLCKDSIAG